MAAIYPCFLGVPNDLNSAIRGLLHLCLDFHIISQDHDGEARAHEIRQECEFVVWAAVIDRFDYRLEILIFWKLNMFELQLRLSHKDRGEFLRVAFLQPKYPLEAEHEGWHFVVLDDSEVLHSWIKNVWPELSRSNKSLSECIPSHERLRGDSPFMHERIIDLFGWFGKLRQAVSA